MRIDALKVVFDQYALAEERKKLIPANETAYEFGLPADYKLPDGFTLDDKHALVQPWRAFAMANGLTQDQFKHGVKMWAEHFVAEERAFAQFKADQRKALGANGDARATALRTWLNGATSTDVAETIMNLAVTTKQFEALEKVMTAAIAQGGTTFNNQHREPPAPPPAPAKTPIQRWGDAIYGSKAN